MNFDQTIAIGRNKTVYRDSDRVIKVFNHDFSKADVLNEALNQARIEETGLNIPKIIEVSTVSGRWAIVSEFIEGKTLDVLMRENPEKEDEYLDLFIKLQMDVHSRRAPLLNKLKDKMNRKITEASIDDTIKYELHTRLEGMPKHKKVCHGDFNPCNIIITPDGVPYIIDWSHATQGNASADVARTYLLFKLAGQDALAEKYLDGFCKASNTEKRYIQSWMPIVAASQSVKGNPHEREFLLHWANVADYE